MTDVERVGKGWPVAAMGDGIEPIGAQPVIPAREQREWEEYRDAVRGIRCEIWRRVTA